MSREITPEAILKEFELGLLFLSAALPLSVLVFVRTPKAFFSCVVGVLVSWVFYAFVKRDAREAARKALAGIASGRIVFSVLAKFYARLLAAGLILGVFFMFGLLDPVALVLGMSIVTIQLFLMFAKLIVKERSLVFKRSV